MEKLTRAIETFTDAADRLDAALRRAGRRSEARVDGAAAQGEVILRLRGEITSLKQSLEAGAPEKRLREAGEADDRVEPDFAVG